MPYVSDAEKIDTLAKMLAGYDDATWAKLRENRKRTYIRAASTLLFDWARFVEVGKEWGRASQGSRK